MMQINTNVALLKKRRTKIIATVGPSSSKADQVRILIESGVNVFRQNMSHGDAAQHREVYHCIRVTAEQLKRPIGILADLCGPKIRVGKFEHGKIELVNNEAVVITTRDVLGVPGVIPSQYPDLATDVKTGDRILLADGTMVLRVDDVTGTEIKCTVIQGGILTDHKGINLPNIKISVPALTEKDKADAKLALELGVDFIALSFVRSADDILALKKLVDEHHSPVDIIAKIEKPEALDNINAILDAADGIMIARGDLGVELNLEQVPVVENQLIDLAKEKLKPVIVATQMLESMIINAVPTRAEVTDIAYAVTLGTDAMMLSGETAVGAFPVHAVKVMDGVARQTESYLWSEHAHNTKPLLPENIAPILIAKAIGNGMVQLAHDLRTRAVVVVSSSGMSVATMSSARPESPILAISKHAHVYRKMTLLWGVTPLHVEDVDEANLHELVRRVVVDEQLASSGDQVLLVRGFSHEVVANTPSLTVITI